MLQRILAVGNAMNAGTSIGDARGIRLGSLRSRSCKIKISRCGNHAIDASPLDTHWLLSTQVKTKGRPRQTSVLDYVAQGLLKRGHARVLTEVVVSLKTKVANASRVPIEDFPQ